MSLRLRTTRVAMAAILATGFALAASLPAHAVGQTINVWLTTADGANKLTALSNITLGSVSTGTVNLYVDDSLQYQTVTGFGAAFTDSSTYLLANLKSANPTQYSSLMNYLFTTSGVNLDFWRLPMTASDFNSTGTPWTDDDVAGPSNNPTQNFGLTAQDTGHIIPVIRDALAINPNLKIVASPWSAPAWMKDNNSMIGNTTGTPSTLLPQYYQAWADYFRKWIQAYQGQGIPIWGITPQNEPLYSPTNYPGMAWDSAGEAGWVHNYLKPTLSGAGLSPVILGFDHNWAASSFAYDLLNSSTSGDFGAIAWHCYDNTSDPTTMTKAHFMNTGKDQYETECSSDTNPTDIIKYSTPEMALLSLQNWAKGVILWNVTLDPSNGPHLGGCTSCVPLVTVDGGSWTKLNNYYQFGQLSKFIAPGATHIGSTVNAHGVVSAAVKNPDGTEVLVVTNTNASSSTFTVTWNGQGSFSYTLPSRATVTFQGTVPAAPVLSHTPLAGHVYKLTGATSGKPIGVDGASTADGGQIVQYTDDGDKDQQWRLQDAGSGYYNLINVNSGKALDDTGGSTSDGTQMQQWTISGTGNSNQQWLFTSVGGGWYTVTNRTSGRVLDLRDGSLSDAAAIQQWTAGSGNHNQQWQLIPIC